MKKRENETIYKQKLESFINQKTHICGKEFGDNNNKNQKIVTKIIIEIKVTLEIIVIIPVTTEEQHIVDII